MNAVAGAQLTFQMLTLQTKMTRDRKCLAPVAQMV